MVIFHSYVSLPAAINDVSMGCLITSQIRKNPSPPSPNETWRLQRSPWESWFPSRHHVSKHGLKIQKLPIPQMCEFIHLEHGPIFLGPEHPWIRTVVLLAMMSNICTINCRMISPTNLIIGKNGGVDQWGGYFYVITHLYFFIIHINIQFYIILQHTILANLYGGRYLWCKKQGKNI